jgi:hypothetical protein
MLVLQIRDSNVCACVRSVLYVISANFVVSVINKAARPRAACSLLASDFSLGEARRAKPTDIWYIQNLGSPGSKIHRNNELNELRLNITG